jgi:hypothetical protein
VRTVRRTVMAECDVRRPISADKPANVSVVADNPANVALGASRPAQPSAITGISRVSTPTTDASSGLCTSTPRT